MSEYTTPNTNTKEWDSYPFTVDGINFVSKIRKGSDFAMRLLFVPNEIFVEMNVGAIRDSIGSVATMTRSEILDELARVNHGGTNAILELA